MASLKWTHHLHCQYQGPLQNQSVLAVVGLAWTFQNSRLLVSLQKMQHDTDDVEDADVVEAHVYSIHTRMGHAIM